MTTFKKSILNEHKTEHKNEHTFMSLKKYSEPKLYDANEDLSKRWYVHYRFRNPNTGKLERQSNIYAGINTIKNLSQRKSAANNLRWSIKRILDSGFNPYEVEIAETEHYTIEYCFQLALTNKKNIISENSYSDLRIRVNKFEKWLNNNGLDSKLYIEKITKKTVINYLNEIANETSSRNRNNTRSNLSILFKTLEDNELIKENFVAKIPVLKSNPERNKTYSADQQEKIYLKLEQDKLLLLFIHFISFNLLRPVEVCRLKIKDIDINDKRIFVRAKNKIDKVKIIPDILIDKLPDLSEMDKELYLFTPNGIGGNWITKENNKRDYFSKRFNDVVKKPLGLGKDYGLYSFRHTFITKLYQELIKNSTPFEAKSKLMLITGHSSMGALEKYLRDIDAVLPDDYSSLLK